MMNLPALKTLIEADQALVAMAQTGNDGGVADALNAPTIPTTTQYQLTTLKVMDKLGPIRGTVVMTTLRAVPDFAEIVRLMDRPDWGVNLKHPDSVAMFGLLVQMAVLSQAEADSIMALRDSSTSLALQQLGGPVTHIDISHAWRLS